MEPLHTKEDNDYKLRPNEVEFELFVLDVMEMIDLENFSRVRKPFEWNSATGGFTTDMKAMVYRFTNEEKMSLLTDALNILNGKYVWTEYVKIGILYTIRTSLKEKITNPKAFTCKVLRTPHNLISAVTDGILSGRRK